jgi:toxin FitB
MSAGLLLDTVVISELRKGARAEPAVIAWQAEAANVPAYLSVITLLEIRVGLRRAAVRDPDFATRLENWYRGRLLPRFRDHLLLVDQPVAEAVAELPTARTLPPYDALLAATARVHGLTLATRNVADFEGAGVSLVNPWDASST